MPSSPEPLCLIRPYRPADRDAVAEVCVRTAHEGGDSRALHPDLRLMPSVFADPYCRFDPDLAFVLGDGTGRAVGYIVVPDAGPLTYLGWSMLPD
ncbi:hypothetical protein [Streptomyces naphthomycinicus]|uniref:hypothetical protein n=1 Tax=Streptomyces naphthomycinicus TaxID=2872625 RepID=UPI003B75C073